MMSHKPKEKYLSRSAIPFKSMFLFSKKGRKITIHVFYDLIRVFGNKRSVS